MLEDASAWDFGLKAFRGLLHKSPSALYRAQPYQPGRIPVVFVHGTASSPAWWIEMWNTLRADPLLRQRFQFWTFLYPSGNPVVISAADLRDAIREKIDRFDPQGRDPAMGQIVVIGHSQGGLLTKLTAVDSGDRLFRSVLDRDLETLPASEEIKADLRRVLMVKPVPEVKRVIFIATPHRGSFLSQQWIRKLIVNLITLPVNVLKEVLTVHQSLYAFFTDDTRQHLGGRVPTSIDDMSPRNPTLLALADTPLAPGVKGHSIVAIDGEEKPPEGDDGVVDYTSAHLEGLESEFVVRAVHSCQGHPLVIEEVRRILLNHLEGL
jgi:pimeloyl-ACP methyl ester carboxylesterase